MENNRRRCGYFELSQLRFSNGRLNSTRSFYTTPFRLGREALSHPLGAPARPPVPGAGALSFGDCTQKAPKRSG